MTGRGEKEWAAGILGQPKGRGGLVSLVLATFARTLAQESDRWFLWLPVVFAGGIVTYFALSNEPNGRVAVTPAAVGLAFLAFASGFAVARLGTEMVRAPVLARELRYAGIGGYVEDHELRDNGRTRLALLSEAAPAPLEVRIWASIDVPRAAINARIRAAGERPERLLRLSSPVSVAALRARPIRPCAIRACSTSSRYPFADLHHEVDAKALALGPTNERPDVLIDRDGMTAALRSDSGNLVFSPATAAGYSVHNWLARRRRQPRCRGGRR
jgi:hypothetical protein